MSSESKKAQTPSESKPKKKTPKPKVSKDKQLLEQILNEKVEIEEKHLRLKAEFENFRRRKEKEISKLLEYEGLDVFTQLLPLFDDIERLLKAFHDSKENIDDSLIKGADMIQSKIDKFLSDWKLKTFGAAGDELDADYHDALMIRSEAGKNDEEILEVFEKGYLYKDRVIRHAKVVVNKS
ncbi:MAG: nucleotide exchange factor GrpE [Candidatus Marinimicrobia bacterium]|nr:nucleotide exchange factor GrpE [Candidatus Neomarinimicrobiota bacterium]